MSDKNWTPDILINFLTEKRDLMDVPVETEKSGCLGVTYFVFL